MHNPRNELRSQQPFPSNVSAQNIDIYPQEGSKKTSIDITSNMIKDSSVQKIKKFNDPCHSLSNQSDGEDKIIEAIQSSRSTNSIPDYTSGRDKGSVTR